MNIASNIERKLQQKVLDTIRTNRLIEQGDSVIVGVSGGPDSVCLLHILHSLSTDLDIKLFAVHINHMLRGLEALADENYAARLCREMEIPLTVKRVDVAAMAKDLGISVEEAGREARYKEFSICAERTGAGKIAVAHNRNDQAETVMMHMIRGTGLAGLIGMEYKRGPVIRPLLNIYRKEIEQYCKEAALSPRTDSSNLEGDFTRNRVRLELFPYLNKNFGANMVDSLYRLSEHASQDNDYLEQCAAGIYRKCMESEYAGQVSLRLEQLQSLHPAILVRVLKRAICDIAGSSKGIGSVHYRTVYGLIAKGNTGAQAELPGGIRAGISYGVLTLSAQNAIQKQPVQKQQRKNVMDHLPFEVCITIPGNTMVEELNANIITDIESAIHVDKYGRMSYNSLVQIFDYDSLAGGINIRSRREGDIFRPFGSNGTKKLKKYFIDNKIPREIRCKIPLICTKNEVVWIVGYKISDKFKVTENTKRILRIEYNWRTS